MFVRRSVAVITVMSSALAAALGAQAQTVVWNVDSVSSIGAHRATVIGSPRVVETDRGRAVEFNGETDGILLDTNPLAGLQQFTIEVEFQPAAGGAEEQRFLHFQESQTENRALVELRMTPGGAWSLDTYLRYGDMGVTLLERSTTHPSGRWYVAALTFDGGTMTHFVDGVRELSGEIAVKPMAAGRTSIGVRQNRTSWFKGRIRWIRITPRALREEELSK